MNRSVPTLTLILVTALLVPTPTLLAQRAQSPVTPVQTPATAPASRPRLPMASLDVQVVISRYQGQKQISSLPYSLAVTANAANETHLNMGAEVPVPSTRFTPDSSASQSKGAGDPVSPPKLIQSVSYRSVGTVIGCRAAGGEDGRYELTISVDDTSVFTGDQAAPQTPVSGAMPVFRSFKARNTLLLQDGQSRQYTAASDRVSGEVVRVEVTLRVVK